MNPIKGSSNIEAVGYANGTLTIRFKSGGTYDYAGVTPEQYHAFVNAESVGSHFHNHIRGKFEVAKREDKK